MAKRTRALRIAEAICDYLSAACTTSAKVLFYKNLLNECVVGTNGVPYSGDSLASQHILPSLDHIRRILSLRGYEIVEVSRRVRDHCVNGSSPDVDGDCLTPAWWETCLPTKGYPAIGIVVFPPGLVARHPLLIKDIKSRYVPGQTIISKVYERAAMATANGHIARNDMPSLGVTSSQGA